MATSENKISLLWSKTELVRDLIVLLRISQLTRFLSCKAKLSWLRIFLHISEYLHKQDFSTVKQWIFLHISEYKWRSLEILARRLWDSLNGIIMTQGQWFLQVFESLLVVLSIYHSATVLMEQKIIVPKFNLFKWWRWCKNEKMASLTLKIIIARKEFRKWSGALKNYVVSCFAKNIRP